jgi:hypothetical protein
MSGDFLQSDAGTVANRDGYDKWLSLRKMHINMS